MKRKNSHFGRLGVYLFMMLIAAFLQLEAASAETVTLMFGVTGSSTTIYPNIVELAVKADPSTFYNYYDNLGPAAPAFTLTGTDEAQIGAIFLGGTQGEGRSIKIVIDTNGNGTFDPYEYEDLGHPWNMTSGTWAYPTGYPGIPYDGGNDDGIIDFDNGESFNSERFEWLWYELRFDRTDTWWLEEGQLMNLFWEGRDQNWESLPNREYKVRASVEYDSDDDGFFDSEVTDTLVIEIKTANITGIVHDKDGYPINGAKVEAGSNLAWGETLTDASGNFTIFGLQAGGPYWLTVRADDKVTQEKEVTIPADGTFDAGTITMPNAIVITGTIQLDRDADGVLLESPDDCLVPFENQWGWLQTDLWVWVDAWNVNGAGWGNAQVVFEYPYDNITFDMNGNMISYVDGAGPNFKTFKINIPPPAAATTYELNINAEGFAAAPVTVTVDNVSGGDAGTIVLTKASKLSGLVTLPGKVSQWTSIDVQAISTANNDERYWGWGEIDPFYVPGSCSDTTWNNQTECESNSAVWTYEYWSETPTPTDTGTFRIDGIPAGTYNLEIRVQNHIPYIIRNLVIEKGVDRKLPALLIDIGNKISGTIKIEGDTRSLMLWEGDDMMGDLSFGVDVWSESGDGAWTDLQAQRGVDVEVPYEIGGLGDGTFEINCWLSEGYELVDDQGNSPVRVILSDNAEQDLVLRPFKGVVKGTISGLGADDMAKVIIEVKRPWDWMPPKIASALLGNVTESGGVYTYMITGLGTGDYIVKAGVYSGFIDYSGTEITDFTKYSDGFLLVDTDVGVGVVTKRTFVQNDQANPTILDISFQQGYSVSGNVALSTTDSPWHDFGDGSGGPPNGVKDTAILPENSEQISMAADLLYRPVMAIPMEMMFMGGEDPRVGRIQYNLDEGKYQYKIDGLAPGVYIIMPPYYSERIRDFETGGAGGTSGYSDEEGIHHWTVNPQVVVISDSDKANVDFTLANGYALSGRITLPEAQTIDPEKTWEEYEWIGELRLETAANAFSGHSRSLMKGDFNETNSYQYKFHHVANGEYMLQFWTDRYVPGTAKVTINNGAATVNLTIEKGANIVGKLVDAETGEAVTGEDGVMVICHAYPYAEGSWRETLADAWSSSYIENDSGIQTSDGTAATEGPQVHTTPGKFHLTSLPTGHNYIVEVRAQWGAKLSGAKNYIGVVKAGIFIPENYAGDYDIGTIKLREGTVIKGRITDMNGNPVPGVDVFGFPSDKHDGTSESEAQTDIKGYYTLYGIDPAVDYYDLIAAEKPDAMGDDWGRVVEWGEKRKYNVAPGKTDANFVLGRASGSLSGTITIPEGAEFETPFEGEGISFPATFILMQKNGVVYNDIMDGVEAMSAPQESDANTTTYFIDNIEPGKYRVQFMNYGLPTLVVENVDINDGANTLSVNWDLAYYKVSGSCTMAAGGYPTSNDITGVVVTNLSDQSLTFGRLTQQADGSFTSFEVPGLVSDIEYQLLFYKDSESEGSPDIFTVGEPFTVSGDNVSINAVINLESKPVLMHKAVYNPTDPSKILLGIFSTTYLVDSGIEIVDTDPRSEADTATVKLFVLNGGGELVNATLSSDKRDILATYTKVEGDGAVDVVVIVHYGENADQLKKIISFNVNSTATNSGVIGSYLAATVKLGNGDSSQLYIKPGKLSVSGGSSTKAVARIEKNGSEPGALAMAHSLSPEETLKEAALQGAFYEAVLHSLPDTAAAAGSQYEFSVTSADEDAVVTLSGAIVCVEYDPDAVADVSTVQLMHLTGGQWVAETENRTVDEENHTICADVTSLSPFIAATVSSGGGDTGGDDTGDDTNIAAPVVSGSSGGSGICFVSVTVSSGSGILPAVVCILMLSLLCAAIVTLKRRHAKGAKCVMSAKRRKR